MILFPFSEFWWLYAGFTALVAVLLALDLGVFHRTAHRVGFREAATWSVVWIGLALLFNLGLYLAAAERFGDPALAQRLGLEFLTGYLVEKALSIDNIFIFVLVFRYFQIPQQYQHRVLFYGIVGAFIMRAVFIAMGSVLMQIHWVVVSFGALLLITGVRMMFGADKKIEPGRNPLIRLFQRFVPVSHQDHGQRFLVKKNGRIHATTLLIALLFLEATDVVFAVDSVPAIFAVTREPLLVFTSNIFAILGLRAMYFLLADAMDRFYLLKYGLGLVLVFVGLKMVWLNQAFGGQFPIGISLAVIAGVIGASAVLSLMFPRRGTATA